VAERAPDDGKFDELVEIERATALLQGRDPRQAESIVAARFASKTQRQEREEMVAKRRDAARDRRRWKLRRAAMAAVGALVVGGVGYWLVGLGRGAAQRADGLRAALTEASAATTELGFVLKDDWLDVGPDGASVEIAAGTCSAVVAVREGGGEGPVAVRVERALKGQVEGPGGQIWCACEPEKAKITLPRAGKARYALRWLAAPGAAVGGIDVLTAAPIRGFSAHVGELDHSCADEALGTWSTAAGHGDAPSLPIELGGVARQLRLEGLEPVGELPADRRFVVVRSVRARCYLAAPDGTPGAVSLRARDGSRLLGGTAKPLAWCNYGEDGPLSLWHDEGSQARYVILSAPAAAVGGNAGLRELGARLELHGLELVGPAEASSDDAVAALRASTVSDASIAAATGDGLPGKPGRVVVAFSLKREGSFQPAGKVPVPMACRPAPDEVVAVNAYVCVQTEAQPWRAGGPANGQAAAEAELPFWLAGIEDARDPAANEAATSLLALSRRLTLLGFEPTTTEGIRDTARGAVVSGRPGKKEALAVAITKARPWTHPLGPLGSAPTWTLDGPLSPTAVAPEDSVELQTRDALGSDSGARRVVVWRR
jgi:hypothetical protein